ncbi:DUF3696 domain-containing protein [Bosea thiooxidans]
MLGAVFAIDVSILTDGRAPLGGRVPSMGVGWRGWGVNLPRGKFDLREYVWLSALYTMREENMLRFGVSNLRRLKDVPEIDLKRINLLVGRNSSGKSSFLRVFPLLRQSLMTRTSSPILWYGDYVDMGNFSGVVRNNSSSDSIVFRFGMDGLYSSPRGYYASSNYFPYGGSRYFGRSDIEIYLSGSDQKTSISRIKSSFFDGEAIFDLTVDDEFHIKKAIMNGDDVTKIFVDGKILIQQGSIFPEITIRSSSPDEGIIFPYASSEFPARSYLVNILKDQLDKRLTDEKLMRIAVRFLSMNGFDDNSLLECENSVNTSSFRKLIRNIRQKDPKKLRAILRNVYFANQIAIAHNAAFKSLREIFINTLYIGPARARSERYYRYQDLAVSEIDSDGKNFPMFLNSLSAAQKEQFSQWVRDRFGYGVIVSEAQGHISISLSVNNQTTNVVDTGYGVSQILPVLGQVWWALNRENSPAVRRREHAPILLIEQPELHLHPAHQALIADAFASERRYERKSRDISELSFIIETHSEALINRIGQLIYENKIDSSDVQILIFDTDQDLDDRETTVKLSHFDSNGNLVNWPYGFFQAG